VHEIPGTCPDQQASDDADHDQDLHCPLLCRSAGGAATQARSMRSAPATASREPRGMGRSRWLIRGVVPRNAVGIDEKGSARRARPPTRVRPRHAPGVCRLRFALPRDRPPARAGAPAASSAA
jgi:hypothetical protein